MVLRPLVLCPATVGAKTRFGKIPLSGDAQKLLRAVTTSTPRNQARFSR
jgi:hypothetical protein